MSRSLRSTGTASRESKWQSMKGSRPSTHTYYYRKISRFKTRMKGLMYKRRRLYPCTDSLTKSRKLGHLKEKLNRLESAREPSLIRSLRRHLRQTIRSEKCVCTERDSTKTLNSALLNSRPGTSKPLSSLNWTCNLNSSPPWGKRSKTLKLVWRLRPNFSKTSKPSSTRWLLNRSMTMSQGP